MTATVQEIGNRAKGTSVVAKVRHALAKAGSVTLESFATMSPDYWAYRAQLLRDEQAEYERTHQAGPDES